MKAIISSVIEKLEAIKNNIDDETTYSTETKEAILNLSSITSALLLTIIEHKENLKCDKTIKSRWC